MERAGAYENYPEITDKSRALLRLKGIKYLFPIQQDCFYPIFNGQDLIGRDLTGTGKTLAFVMPLVERLRKQKLLGTRKIQAIVLTPTRELAVQVSVHDCSDYINAYSCVIRCRQCLRR